MGIIDLIDNADNEITQLKIVKLINNESTTRFMKVYSIKPCDRPQSYGEDDFWLDEPLWLEVDIWYNKKRFKAKVNFGGLSKDGTGVRSPNQHFMSRLGRYVRNEYDRVFKKSQYHQNTKKFLNRGKKW